LQSKLSHLGNLHITIAIGDTAVLHCTLTAQSQFYVTAFLIRPVQ